MDLTHGSIYQAVVCYSQRSATAILAALGSVVLISSIVACGNSAGAGHNTPIPTMTISNGVPGGGSGPPVGGDSVAPPSAPVVTQSNQPGGITGPPTGTPSPGPDPYPDPDPDPTSSTPTPSNPPSASSAAVEP